MDQERLSQLNSLPPRIRGDRPWNIGRNSWGRLLYHFPFHQQMYFAIALRSYTAIFQERAVLLGIPGMA